jgi:tRNA-guanine family transglycosylase
MQYGNLRREFMMDDDVVLFSDSGGFSIIGGTKALNAYQVADWYNEAGVDIGFILDYPPNEEKLKKDIAHFDESLEATIINSKIMRERVKSSIKLYAVIHGLDNRSAKKWFDGVNMVADWDGYAFGGYVFDIGTLFRWVKFVEENVDREKPVHFLAFGKNIEMLLLSRWSKKTGRVITTDFTTMTIQTIRHALFTTPIGKLRLGTEKEDRIGSKVFCLCPVCRKYGDKVFEEWELLLLHNMYFALWTYGVIDSISMEDPDVLGKYIKGKKHHVSEVPQLIRKLDGIIEKKGGLAEYV